MSVRIVSSKAWGKWGAETPKPMGGRTSTLASGAQRPMRKGGHQIYIIAPFRFRFFDVLARCHLLIIIISWFLLIIICLLCLRLILLLPSSWGGILACDVGHDYGCAAHVPHRVAMLALMRI